MKTQFMTDNEGNRTADLLPIKKYNKMIEKLEDFENVRRYDKAKKNDDGCRISLEDFMKTKNDYKSSL